MNAPFTTIPLAGQITRVIDMNRENVTVMPAKPAGKLVALVNTIPPLVAALKAITIAAWNSGNENLLDLACAGEEAVRLVEPSFALCMWTAPFTSDCAPASRDAGEDNPPGS